MIEMEEKKLFLEPKQIYTKEDHDIFNGELNNTKPIYVKVRRKTEIEDTEIITDNNIKTWSQLIRAVMNSLYPYIVKITKTETNFEQIFNNEMEGFIEKNNIKHSESFSPKLFTIYPNENTVSNPRYSNSANCQILITEDPVTHLNKYICAVYTNEILWVLQVLLNTLNRYSTDLTPYYFYIEVIYLERIEESNLKSNIRLINQFTDNFELVERCSIDLHKIYASLADIKLSLSTLLKYTTSDITDERITNIMSNLHICSELIVKEFTQLDKVKEDCLVEFRDQAIKRSLEDEDK